MKHRYTSRNPAMQAIIDAEVDRMLAAGIIEPSQSPWSSPVVLVRKKNGKYRFSIDFQQVNTRTEKDALPAAAGTGHAVEATGGQVHFDHRLRQLVLAGTTRPRVLVAHRLHLSGLGLLPVHGNAVWAAICTSHVPTATRRSHWTTPGTEGLRKRTFSRTILAVEVICVSTVLSNMAEN